MELNFTGIKWRKRNKMQFPISWFNTTDWTHQICVFLQRLAGFIPCTVGKYCKTDQTKVQRDTGNEFASFICLNTHLKEKCKDCDNNWEKNQNTIALQNGLLGIFISLYVYSSTYINRQHCSKRYCPAQPPWYKK